MPIAIEKDGKNSCDYRIVDSFSKDIEEMTKKGKTVAQLAKEWQENFDKDRLECSGVLDPALGETRWREWGDGYIEEIYDERWVQFGNKAVPPDYIPED
jgi:hypothetical protein